MFQEKLQLSLRNSSKNYFFTFYKNAGGLFCGKFGTDIN
jgi:hypothetical protein